MRNKPPIYDIYETIGNLNTVIVDIKELLAFLCVIIFKFEKIIFLLHTAIFMGGMNLKRKVVNTN